MVMYKVCIKFDNLIVYDWYSIGMYNYFLVDEILFIMMKNYIVFVLGINVGGRISDFINGLIFVINIVFV